MTIFLCVCILRLELQVRLRSGTTSNQGRVELFLNGTWGTICDDSFGIEEANVICRMLGYTEGAWSTHCCGWYDMFSGPDQIWLDDVHCVGDERSIAECSHGGWGSHNCDHSEDVGVVCKYTPLPPPGKTLRFVLLVILKKTSLHESNNSDRPNNRTILKMRIVKTITIHFLGSIIHEGGSIIVGSIIHIFQEKILSPFGHQFMKYF